MEVIIVVLRAKRSDCTSPIANAGDSVSVTKDKGVINCNRRTKLEEQQTPSLHACSLNQQSPELCSHMIAQAMSIGKIQNIRIQLQFVKTGDGAI